MSVSQTASRPWKFTDEPVNYFALPAALSVVGFDGLTSSPFDPLWPFLFPFPFPIVLAFAPSPQSCAFLAFFPTSGVWLLDPAGDDCLASSSFRLRSCSFLRNSSLRSLLLSPLPLVSVGFDLDVGLES